MKEMSIQMTPIPIGTVMNNRDMDSTIEQKQVPVAENSKKRKRVPKAQKAKQEVALPVHQENCISFNGKLIQIFPTKLKYFRNKTASVYKILKLVPLTQFLTYDRGVVDEERDADQILYDFLVAVFDSEEIVHSIYDDITADDVQNILNIFGRLNHIDQKEEANEKKRQAQMTH